jgi:hypothetical protein
VNKTARSRPGRVVIPLDEHHSAKPLPLTTRTQFVQHAEVVAEVDLSLPIGVFNLTVARMGRRTRICGRPTRGWCRACVMATRSALCVLGCIVDAVIDSLWPAEAVARAPRLDFAEPEERQAVRKPMHRPST